MRLLTALALVLAVVPHVGAQDATQSVRVHLLSNDATAGGSLQVALQARASTHRATQTALGSATIDLLYDAASLTLAASDDLVGAQPGYTGGLSPVACGAGTCYRYSVTSAGVGGGSPGVDVGTDWTTLVTLTFTLDATSAAGTALAIHRPSLSVGYYDSAGNGSGNGWIEDNTGTVGDDVVAVEAIDDLTTATLSLDDDANWYLLGAPGTGATVGDLLSGVWTQGFPGADATGGPLSVAFWDETAGGYVAPADAAAALVPGVGLAAYAFADDDADGADDPFPKTSLVAVEPGDDRGGPVNAAAPDPYQPDLPFAFPLTYTTGTGVPEGPGWNLLANPTAGTADWDAAGWTRTDVSDAFYTWEPGHVGGPQYVSWSAGIGGTRADGLLAPFEGFWAEASRVGAVLEMPGAAYSLFAPREAATPRVRLHVAGSVGGQERATEVLVAFSEAAEPGHDPHDARELIGPVADRLHLMTEVDGEALDVDVRPLPGEEGAEIPVAVAAVASGGGTAADLVLTWPEVSLDPEVALFLLDTETDAVVDLRTATSHAFHLPAIPAGRVDPLALPRPQSFSAEAARPSGTARFVLFVGTAPRPVALTDEPPTAFGFAAPAPNPTAGAVTLRFSLAEAGPARLAVYDALGREVAVPHDAETPAGASTVAFDTRALASGVYLVRLEAAGEHLHHTFTVAR